MLLKLANSVRGHWYCALTVISAVTLHQHVWLYNMYLPYKCTSNEYMWGWELWMLLPGFLTHKATRANRKEEQNKWKWMWLFAGSRAAFLKEHLNCWYLNTFILVVLLIFEYETWAWTLMFSTSLSPSRRSSNWSWRWTAGSQRSQPVINSTCFLIWAYEAMICTSDSLDVVLHKREDIVSCWKTLNYDENLWRARKL